MRAVRATDGGARSTRPPRGADGAAGRTEPGAMRGRSRLERAAEQYTAGAGGAAVGPVHARGAGRARAVRATERRQVGCGRPSTGSGWWWGVAPWVVIEGSTFFSFFSFFSLFSFLVVFAVRTPALWFSRLRGRLNSLYVY